MKLSIWLSGLNVLMSILASDAARAEERLAYPLATGDWLEVDRKRFQALSTRLSGPELINAMPAVVTFSNAALHNTREARPSEYKSVEQRNAYYNLVSLVIEHDRNTPAPLKEIKFFHAATIVTLWTQVGAIDAVDNVFCVHLSPETRSFLRDINQRLFDANFRIISRLMFDWKEPRDPAGVNPAVSMTPWEFDVAMVRMEQRLVESMIKERKPAPKIRQEINSIDNCVLSHIGAIGTRGASTQWVADAIGKPDFFDIEHRKAIGYSMITMLHRRPKSDFEALRKVP